MKVVSGNAWKRRWNSLLCTATLLCFTTIHLHAQVYPPDLLCVKSDTIVWDLPTNTCGPFNSYLLYASTDASGPYFVLATITDPSQTTYFHDNANNMLWYYYLTTDADCPGEPVLASDTLDNQPPAISPLVYTDVLNGKVLLQWTPSPSPEVIGYIIYRVTEIGTIPIDTVTTITYYDLGSEPTLQAENYYVIALDACGNTSLLADPHRTVLLSAQSNSCDQSFDLQWNLYEGWTAIERQEIWVGLDGATPELVKTLGSSDTSAVIDVLVDGAVYCMTIKSYDVTTGLVSSSNEVCTTADIVAPVRDLLLKNVTVTSNNTVDLLWQWNTDAELLSTDILSTTSSTDVFSIVETLSPGSPLSLNNTYTHSMATPTSGPIYYQILTRDICDSTRFSNQGTTIFLSGSATGSLKNQLQWTPFMLGNATINHYEVFRLDESGTHTLGQVAADVYTLLDGVDPRKMSESNVCYYVVAEAVMTLPDGGSEVVYSQSNTLCIQQPTTIFTPNAFAPNGINNEFKPLLRFGQTANYQMTIWDRWGQNLFETNDIDVGWTGRKGFVEYPMGVYTYQIKVVQPDGQVVENSGVVVLVR